MTSHRSLLLTGAIGPQTTFDPDDFRSGSRYRNSYYRDLFAEGRIERSLAVVDAIRRAGAGHGSLDPAVVPGIIDNHNHIVLMGNRPGHHTPLENARSIADVQGWFLTNGA